MYKDDIRRLYFEKREANWYILRDFIKIYLSLRVGFPNLVEERENLVKLVQMYFDVDQNEKEVLSCIKQKYGKVKDHEGIDELLDTFDSMFEHLYDHIERTFLDYEEVMMDYGDFIDFIAYRINSIFSGKPLENGEDTRYRMKHFPIRFQLFDNSYKEKMLEYIPNLPEPIEEEF